MPMDGQNLASFLEDAYLPRDIGDFLREGPFGKTFSIGRFQSDHKVEHEVKFITEAVGLDPVSDEPIWASPLRSVESTAPSETRPEWIPQNLRSVTPVPDFRNLKMYETPSWRCLRRGEKQNKTLES
jgi:hypothetical protein